MDGCALLGLVLAMGIGLMLIMSWADSKRRRVQQGTHPSFLSQRLSRVAELASGEVHAPAGDASGQVTWLRDRRRYYYWESQLEGEWWSFLGVLLRNPLLPSFQVCQKGTATPFPPHPDTCVRPTGILAFDERYEVRRPAIHDTEELPLSRNAFLKFLDVMSEFQASPVLEVQRTRCRVGRKGLLSRLGRAKIALIEGCRLLDMVLAQYAPGDTDEDIVLFDVRAQASDAPAICRVCGVGIREDRVECAKCGTPHHRECWDYTGGCSIYACESRERHG